MFNKSGTFVYTPDIRVLIGKEDGTVLDVSGDVVDFQMDRQINAISTFMCTLANPRRKYNGNINTLDRIVVYLKRVEWMQCFSGYITYAPIETFVPTPVQIRADCTLKLLQNTYWDDTLIQYQKLLLNYMDGTARSSNKTLNDGGVAQALVNLLYKVAGWDSTKIHIQGIPSKFVDFAATAYATLAEGKNSQLSQTVVLELQALLDAAGYVNGKSTTTTNADGSTTVSREDAPATGGVNITATKAYPLRVASPKNGGQVDYPQPNANNPSSIEDINKDVYYCTAHYSYLDFTGPKHNENAGIAKEFLAYNRTADNQAGRPLVVMSQKTKRAVAVRVCAVPQDSQGNYDKDFHDLQLHPGVIAYLTGHGDDPTKATLPTSAKYANIDFNWIDQTSPDYEGIGVQKGLEARLKETANAALNLETVINQNLVTANIDAMIEKVRAQVGGEYSQGGAGGSKDWYGGKLRGRESPATSTDISYFDCSGLAQWGYAQVGVKIGAATPWQNGYKVNGVWGEKPEVYGTFIDKNTKPQKGDLLFWVHGDSSPTADHVSILTSNFNGGVATHIQAWSWGMKTDETKITWAAIKGGGNNQGYEGNLYYIGARRPVSLGINGKLPPSTPPSSTDTSSPGSAAAAPKDPQEATTRALLSLSHSWNTIMQTPQFDPRASAVLGSPRAFMLDHPLLNSIQQIAGAGLRSFMSAPNGDFIAWFPDYYGIYGTEPVLEIQDVEVIDCQIYHDDGQLTTHVGIIGDTNGIGQQVSNADYLTTNGIVSMQDTTTMQLLFGQVSAGDLSADASSASNFLNRYGMRPYVEEQNLIHSHQLEYFYALMTFMTKWTDQYISLVQFTFMPEIYPGMRVVINVSDEDGPHVYEFYVTSVMHQGNRSTGFTTQAGLTAPKKDGIIMHYGTNWNGEPKKTKTPAGPPAPTKTTGTSDTGIWV